MTIAGQIVEKVLGGFSKNILTKIKIARPPVARSVVKSSQVGFDMTRRAFLSIYIYIVLIIYNTGVGRS